jgi:internalin A
LLLIATQFQEVACMPSETVSRPWRRFLRLSVRGLIVLVLVLGVWLGWLVHSARIQRDAVAAIKSAGGRVSYDWEWNNGKSLPAGKPSAPQWLVDLIGVDYFDHVTYVFLTPSVADDAAFAQVGRLTHVQTLIHDQSSWDCEFTTPTLSDAGLSHLTGLTHLSELCFRDSRVTDAGLVHLKGLTNLTLLFLDRNQITDAGLAHLTGLKKLTSLSLSSSQITDAGLVHLKGLTDLSELNLGGTQITDAGLVQLKRLTHLSKLNLSATQIADAGLVHLKGLSNLSELDLNSKRVTEAGARELQRFLPKLKIYRY